MANNGYLLTNATTGKISPSNVLFYSGTEVELLAASSDLIGATYFATDSQKIFQCISATEWTVTNLGPNKTTLGPFSDSAYLSNAGANGPIGGVPYTWVMNFYVESLPGTNGKVMWCYSNAAATKGFIFGGSTTASNTMRFQMPSAGNFGLNELPGAVLTTGPHTLAMCLKTGGTSIHYAFDGTLQTDISSATGTWTDVTTDETHFIGRWVTSTLPCDWASISWVQTFNADISDDELEKLSTDPDTYFPSNISVTPNYYWASHWEVPFSATTPRVTIGSQSYPLIVTGPSSLIKTDR